MRFGITIKAGEYDPEKLRIALTESALIVESDAKILCPVDTGRLRASITSRVNGMRAEIGSDVEYAAHVEYRNGGINSYLRRALFQRLPEIKARLAAAVKDRTDNEEIK